MLIIDTCTDTVTGKIRDSRNSLSYPGNIATTSDFSTAFITNLGTSNDGYSYEVSVVDIALQKVIGHVSGFFNAPYNLAISSDDSTAYVVNLGNNTISVIDVATLSEVGSIDDSTYSLGRPYAIAIQP